MVTKCSWLDPNRSFIQVDFDEKRRSRLKIISVLTNSLSNAVMALEQSNDTDTYELAVDNLRIVLETLNESLESNGEVKQ